jgi:DNA polymerase-1
VSGPLDQVHLHLVDDLSTALRLKSWLGERHANNLVAVDTETTGLDPRDPGSKVRLIQFGDTQHGWAVPWENWRGLALEILHSWDGTWGLWNSSFEGKWLGHHADYTFPRDRTVDGMLGAHIIDPLGSGALKTNAVRHFDSRAGAGQNLLHQAMHANGWTWATVPVHFDRYHEYAALDAVLTAGMWDVQKDKLSGAGAYKGVFDMEMAVRFIVSAMERRGSRVDLGYSKAKFDLLSSHADKIEAWGQDALGVNLGSTQQLARMLQRCGYEFTAFTATGLPQVDKHLLKMLANPDLGHPEALQLIAQQVLLMRHARKYASTYFSSFISLADANAMIHTDIRTLGARTGRMSSSTPNIQNCPKDSALVRNAFVPTEGNVLVSCDYAQIEMRIMAELSRDPDLQQAFRTADDTGGDFFVEMGKQIYLEPGFQKKDKRRRLLKNTMYGRIFGAGPEKMAESAGIPVDQMREVVAALDVTFPGINTFMKQVEQVGKARQAANGQGYVTTPVGRRLPCDENKTYTLTNYLIQSSAADVLKKAIIRLDAAGYSPFMIFPVHDEVVFDLPVAYVDQALHDVPLIMQELDHPVPLLAEASGPFERWGEAVEA